MQARQRAKDRALFSQDDIPQEYLSAPIQHLYRPELEVHNAQRRAQRDFETLNLSPNNEKYYRLYFYQGMSPADRLIVHTEGLEMRMKVYIVFGLSFVAGFSTFFLMAGLKHAKDRPMLRLAVGAASTYFAWDFQRRYHRHRFESAVEPFYEKYQIK